MSKDNVGLAKDFSYDAVSNDHFIAIHSWVCQWKNYRNIVGISIIGGAKAITSMCSGRVRCTVQTAVQSSIP